MASGSADRAVARFSTIGEHGAVWLAIGGLGALADGARRAEWLAAVRRVAIAYFVNQLVKVLVRRRRPLTAVVATHSTLSFPSAHATTSFAGARVYARLGLPAAALYALAGALAGSRLWLRVHHPTDVLAGAALGTVLASRR